MGTSALPYGPGTMINLTAKDDIDNVGAGRAAKGATLVTCSKKQDKFQSGTCLVFIQTERFGM